MKSLSTAMKSILQPAGSLQLEKAHEEEWRPSAKKKREREREIEQKRKKEREKKHLSGFSAHL